MKNSQLLGYAVEIGNGRLKYFPPNKKKKMIKFKNKLKIKHG